MLALKSKLKMTLLMAGTLMFLISSAFGQQTPSQRYQPVTDGAIQHSPPSVHVPPQQTQPLAPQFRQAIPNYQTGQPDNRSTNFTFSDPAQPTGRAQQPSSNQLRGAMRPGFENARPGSYANQPGQGMVRQTSFQTDDNGQPVVPDILAGGPAPTTPATSGMTQGPPNFQPTNHFQPTAKLPTSSNMGTPQSPGAIPVVNEAPPKTPSDFASSMSQLRGNGPRVAPAELANQGQDELAEMVAFRQRVKARADAEAKAAELAVNAQAEQQEIARLEAEKQEAQRVHAEKMAAAKAEAQRMSDARKSAEVEQAKRHAAQQAQTQLAATERAQVEREAADRIAAEKTEADLAAQTSQISASDFIGQIASGNGQSPTQDPNTSPTSVAQRMEKMPAVMQLTNGFEADAEPTPETVVDTQVRQVSSETDTRTDSNEASITLAAPAIEVETFGPKTVGVNKPADYKVVVTNNSSSQAEQILVGINMPQWIDIQNINMTTGGKEITDGQNQARLVWSIDQIPGNSSQTITITATPRKAEMFDVGVEWTLVPRVGKANIRVTEPKLDMNISGPKEVLYGESALYHVTVRNPGTGTAENIIVMLPEALGGDRQPLGDIEAGKEKSFQVELLARTAGNLNLIVTASGDQNLKVSSERDLVVRRANLEISLDGPGLKYSGSLAQYQVTITNSGDASASDIVAAVALPAGVKYLGGIESVKLIEGGMRWSVGSLDPAQTRTYKINCQLDTSGDLQLEVGARGKGDLAASSACLTTVETVADLVLTVADPKGPLPTGEEIPYVIKIQNRGSRTAKGVNLVMQFSEGIEPKGAAGVEHRIVPGQVLFSPIPEIEPGQEVTFKVTAEALKSGTHIFRAQLTCQDSDAREIAEGTTRFFGDAVQPAVPQATTSTANSNDKASGFAPSGFGDSGFKR